MITEVMFAILIFSMLICLIVSLYFQNDKIAAITMVLCLFLAFYLFPGSGGIMFKIGTTNNLTTTTTENKTSTATVLGAITTTTEAGDQNSVTTGGTAEQTDNFTSIPLGTLFAILAIGMGAEIMTFRRQKRKQERGEE